MSRSQYFDEDGDIAHEFYEERPWQSNNNGKIRMRMRRKTKGLTPEVSEMNKCN